MQHSTMEDETGFEEPFSHLDGPAPAFRQRDDEVATYLLRPRILAWSQPRRVEIALSCVLEDSSALSYVPQLSALPGALSVTHVGLVGKTFRRSVPRDSTMAD